VFGRLPIHFANDRNVYHHTQQGQPVGGYTHMVGCMLDHPKIEVTLKRSFNLAFDKSEYSHVFYSGPIDRYFDWRFGRLAYRTLEFEVERSVGKYQDCGTVNYCDLEVPYTRIAEHKHFSEWEKHEETVYSFEFSRECGHNDIPYYPVPLIEENTRYMQYVDLARNEPSVSFVGRLGTYRYLDMDVAIGEAMDAGSRTIEAVKSGAPLPTFFVTNLRKHG
jgi:UDP-galactopyranose mutase